MSSILKRRARTATILPKDSSHFVRNPYAELLVSTDDPDVATVTSKGQITIPSRLREQFGLEKGTKLMVVPTDYGIVLKKLELPSIEEFQQRVEERVETDDLSMDEVNQLVHEARCTKG